MVGGKTELPYHTEFDLECILPVKTRIQFHQLFADGFRLLVGRQGLNFFDPLLEGGGVPATGRYLSDVIDPPDIDVVLDLFRL